MYMIYTSISLMSLFRRYTVAIQNPSLILKPKLQTFKQNGKKIINIEILYDRNNITYTIKRRFDQTETVTFFVYAIF